MKKIIPVALIGFFLSSCSLFHVSKMEVEQGNVITNDKISQLHQGMTEDDVKNVMGNPVLVNIFTPDRIEYIYTFQKGHCNRLEKRVTCIFRNNILKEVIVA
jgi:outer membrane protein assembly factor BamE